MNVNLISCPLLFIGSGANRLKLVDYSKKSNQSNKLPSDLNSVISIPYQSPFKYRQIHDTHPILFKKGRCDKELVTYIGSALKFDHKTNHHSNDSHVPSTYGSKALLNTLSKVFSKEGLSKLNPFQLSLFDELTLGRDVILHSYTSSGKTFSILLYMSLRYYYQLPLQCLSSKSFSEILNSLKTVDTNDSLHFNRKKSTLTSRVLILCPTKELAVQSYKQLSNFTDGNEESIRLIIDQDVNVPKIGPETIFIVGSSNQVESYFLNNDPKHTRSVLQTVDYVFLDEMDRLIKVPNQYATEMKKKKISENPGSAFNICQTLLSISPNKLRFVLASASVSRRHIRKINNLIQLYRNNRENLTAVIRKKTTATETGRYVSIPDTIKHYYSLSSDDSQESKIKKLIELLKDEKGKSIVFLSSGSLLSLKEELKKVGIECKILHHEFGIEDNCANKEGNKSDRTLKMITKLQEKFNKGRDKFVLVASTESARGIHIPMLDSVYILGKTRNVNEYIHISGRVGRCSRTGRCITIDTEENIKILLSWQKQMNTKILQIFDDNHPNILKTKDQ